MNDLCVTMINKRGSEKCRLCASYVVPPRMRLERDPILADDYCKNPKSPYFMRTPAGRCDCFKERSND